MAKKNVITQEQKEFRKEFFEWLQSKHAEEYISANNWKEELIEYIYEQIKEEGKEVKKESIRRNLNRMLAFYFDTGAQARSGKRYWEYIERWYNEKVKSRWEERMLIDPNATIVAKFLKVEHAVDYKADIEVLYIVPDFETMTIDIYRYYPEPTLLRAI